MARRHRFARRQHAVSCRSGRSAAPGTGRLASCRHGLTEPGLCDGVLRSCRRRCRGAGVAADRQQRHGAAASSRRKPARTRRQAPHRSCPRRTRRPHPPDPCCRVRRALPAPALRPWRRLVTPSAGTSAAPGRRGSASGVPGNQRVGRRMGQGAACLSRQRGARPPRQPGPPAEFAREPAHHRRPRHQDTQPEPEDEEDGDSKNAT